MAVARNALTYNFPAKLALDTVEVLKRYVLCVHVYWLHVLVKLFFVAIRTDDWSECINEQYHFQLFVFLLYLIFFIVVFLLYDEQVRSDGVHRSDAERGFSGKRGAAQKNLRHGESCFPFSFYLMFFFWLKHSACASGVFVLSQKSVRVYTNINHTIFVFFLQSLRRVCFPCRCTSWLPVCTTSWPSSGACGGRTRTVRNSHTLLDERKTAAITQIRTWVVQAVHLPRMQVFLHTLGYLVLPFSIILHKIVLVGRPTFRVPSKFFFFIAIIGMKSSTGASSFKQSQSVPEATPLPSSAGVESEEEDYECKDAHNLDVQLAIRCVFRESFTIFAIRKLWKSICKKEWFLTILYHVHRFAPLALNIIYEENPVDCQRLAKLQGKFGFFVS